MKKTKTEAVKVPLEVTSDQLRRADADDDAMRAYRLAPGVYEAILSAVAEARKLRGDDEAFAWLKTEESNPVWQKAFPEQPALSQGEKALMLHMTGLTVYRKMKKVRGYFCLILGAIIGVGLLSLHFFGIL